MTYDELIKHLKTISDKQQQIEYLFKYMLQSVQYDYPTLEICKFDNSLLDYIDTHYNPEIAEDRQKVIQLIKSKGYSNEFILRILENYGKSFIVPARPEMVIMGKLNKAIPEHTDYRTFASAKNMAKPLVEYKNGFIIKGVCADFSEFIKNICDELNIPCNIVNGATPISHVWNLINVGDGFKHYDLTYAIYARDEFNGWGKVNPSNFLGVTTKKLLEMHPSRTIDSIYTSETTL